jgi:hypothetical protein
VDAAYHRAYRARRKAEGRPVDAGRSRLRKDRAPEDRRREYARRASRARPVPELFPEVRAGSRVSFWEDELRMDLCQEAVLAELEGRDPVAAVTAYRARETAWRRLTCPLVA